MKTKFAVLAMSLVVGLSGCNAGDGIFVPAGERAVEKGERATQDIRMFTVTSNKKPGKVYTVLLRVDANTLAVSRLIYRSSEGDTEYTLDKLKSSEGLVLLVEQGYKVVRLKSSNFTAADGGAVRMIYLKNALFGSEGTFNMDIVREGQNWVVYSNNSDGRKKFSRMHIEAGSMGVKSVSVQ